MHLKNDNKASTKYHREIKNEFSPCSTFFVVLLEQKIASFVSIHCEANTHQTLIHKRRLKLLKSAMMIGLNIIYSYITSIFVVHKMQNSQTTSIEHI